MSATKKYPRWPLAFIAAPAGVAVWSGWVGLGQLCGFGLIHPLPGIANGFTINSAITLPVGVEAYGAYALGAWLTPGTSDRARTFAKRSALAALGMGMGGQVIYHLLAAAHATKAPWPVVVLVSCLPVVALALGSALAHLLRESAEDEVPTPQPVQETEAVSAGVPGMATVPDPMPAYEAVAEAPGVEPLTVPEIASESVPASTAPTVPGAPVRTVSETRAPRRASGRKPGTPERVFADELSRGELPSLRAVKQRMGCGTDRARSILSQLSEGMEAMADA